jgi:exodeoxyribonuclease VII small subunit
MLLILNKLRTCVKKMNNRINQNKYLDTINYLCPMKKSDQPSYEAAYSELRLILSELQDGTVGIDALTAKVERANELVRFCRERLRLTEEAVQQLSQQNPTA